MNRVRKILEIKLNGGNFIKGIYTWAIPALRNSAAFLNWTKTELEGLDRRTKKLLTLYIPRKEGGKVLKCGTLVR